MKNTAHARQTGLLVGITGGIASGKSRAGSFLQHRLEAEYLDADEVARELLLPSAKGWEALQQAFGNKYFRDDQSADRTKIRKDIFTDEVLRHKFNQLLHPLIREEIWCKIREAERSQPPFILVEVPLLFEVNWRNDFDKIVVIYASRAICLKRLMKRDPAAANEAEQTFMVQWPLNKKALLADHVIDNNGCWPYTCLQLLQLCRTLSQSLKKTVDIKYGLNL